MGLIDLASEASRRRGYDYFERGKVLSCRQTDKARFEGRVSGSGENVYQVSIDLEHPRSSQCSCPYAADRQNFCKHMAALFFIAFPEEAAEYCRKVIEAEEKAEREREEQDFALVDLVLSMKKKDLQEALLQILFEGPEWQYERFVDEYLCDYSDDSEE